MNLFIGGTSNIDPDVVEVSSSLASSSLSPSQKRKRSQVVPHEIIVIDEDDDTEEVVIISENLSDKKNKQPMKYEKCSKIQVKDGNSITKLKTEKDVPLGKLNGFVLDPLDFKFEDYEYVEYDSDEDEEKDDDNESDYDMTVFVNDKTNLNLADQFDKLDLPPRVRSNVPWLRNEASRMPIVNPILINEDEIDIKFKAFKQFDSVRDSADHHFHSPELLKPGKDWVRRIQQEWKVLKKDLPETIYIRIYEDRMDLLRSVIIGPAGTPYHDGLFFFDIYVPPTYPLVPPMVHYHSGGLRLNPNLYACGKVCLSLLNTWSGHGCERWNPTNSTMLQVLVSIQALVLNAKPYFNEPGYASSANTSHGEVRSLSYNEDMFILSCKTMLYSLRKPPKHFEDFVAGHFRNNGRKILAACRAYIQGAQVGCLAGNMAEDVDERVKGGSATFKLHLTSLFEPLKSEFIVKGADCQMLLLHNPKDGAAAVASVRLI